MHRNLTYGTFLKRNFFLYTVKISASFAFSQSQPDPETALVTEIQTAVMSRSVCYKQMKAMGRARLQLHLVEERFYVAVGAVQGGSSDCLMNIKAKPPFNDS